MLAVASALLLGLMVYRWGARVAAAVGFVTVCIFSLGSLWAFSRGILLDAVFPIMTSSAAYIFGTGYLYYEAESERNRGREALQRIAREMEAAAQIQRTFLPKETPRGPFESKFEIFAVMKPAKAVGGDFYDYFLIDDQQARLRCRRRLRQRRSGGTVHERVANGAAHRRLRATRSPGVVLSKVNAILSRDNTEGMFVTIFYAVLDLETGSLAFSSAGHDDAMLLTRRKRLRAAGLHGPGDRPLSTRAEYPTATRSSRPGDTMMLLTDGITEAFNIDGRVFTFDRIVQIGDTADVRERRRSRAIAHGRGRRASRREPSSPTTSPAWRMRFKG